MNSQASHTAFHYTIICFFGFTTLFFPCCESMEEAKHPAEKNFYAISSLCYHLNELLPETEMQTIDDEQILFDEGEIANLWNEANKGLPSQELKKAQHYYYLAKTSSQENTMAAKKFYEKSKTILNKVWKKVSSILFEYSLSEISDENFIPNYYRALTYPNLENNPIINEDMARKMAPYLLPINHPLKKSLDAIFEKSRAIKNEKSFDNAGFTTLFFQTIHSYIRVAKHKALPGYLIKVYFDSEPNERARKGWEHLRNRCEGAENVRKLIKSKKIEHFTVPNKWLYVLPANIPSNIKDQPVILVVTDMKLVSDKKTEEAWKTKITHEHLDELYCIISHGLGSSGLVRNVPYTKDKIFTFIDTEKPKKVPNYSKARHYLSQEMRNYWDKLVKTGGNKS